MFRRDRRRVFLMALLAFLLIPAAALAGTLFIDVADGSTHFKGIEFMKSSGVTLGCGDGTTYCPKDPVLRENMATFMYRLSGNDPATPPSVNADKLDGWQATELLRASEGYLAAPITDLANSTLVTASTTAPRAGYLVVNASAVVANFSDPAVVACGLDLDDPLGDTLAYSPTFRYVDLGVVPIGSCATNGLLPVDAGLHTVSLEVSSTLDPADLTTEYGPATLTVVFVPFGSDGTPLSTLDLTKRASMDANALSPGTATK